MDVSGLNSTFSLVCCEMLLLVVACRRRRREALRLLAAWRLQQLTAATVGTCKCASGYPLMRSNKGSPRFLDSDPVCVCTAALVQTTRR